MPPDDYLAERLETLENLCADNPNLPETRHARRLVCRVRFYRRRGLTPLKRRYLLADIRAMTRIIERTHHE